MNHEEVIGLYTAATHIDCTHLRRVRGGMEATNTRILVQLGDLPVRALSDTVAENGWEGLPCMLGVRGDAVVLRTFRLADGERVSELLERKTEDFTRDAPDEMIVGSLSMQDDKGAVVLMAIVRREIAEKLCADARTAGLRPVGVVPASVAMYNGAARYLAEPRSGEALAVLDVEDHYSELLVGQGSCLHFARGVQAGSIDLEDPNGSGNWAKKLENLRSLLEEDDGIPPVGTVALAGLSDPVDAEIPTLATRSLHGIVVPVQQAAKHRDQAVPPLAAAGLALMGAGEGVVDLNLHPDGPSRAPARAWPWFVAAAILLTGLLLSLGLFWNQRRALDRHLQNTRMGLAGLNKMEKERDQEAALIAELERLLVPLDTGVSNLDHLHEILSAVQDAKASNDWIVLIADSDSYFDEDPEAAPTLPDPAESNLAAEAFARLVIEGYTPLEDLSSVRAMIGAINQHPAIRQADILGDDMLRESSERDARWAATSSTLFAVEITLASEFAPAPTEPEVGP